MVIVLIIIAAATALALGLFTGPFVLVWVALCLSLLGVALVVVSMIRGRTQAIESESTEVDEPSDAPADGPVAADAEPAVEADQEAGEQPVEVSTADAVAADEAPALETVLVRTGRSRFHREGCRVLDGVAAVERIHVDEAAAEGFTACSVCIPDRASLRV